LSEQVEQKVVQSMSTTAGQTAPVMVVLAQGTTLPNIPPRNQIQLTSKGDRLRYAAELYFKSGAPTVIVTGSARFDVKAKDDARLQETNEVVTVLEQLGVPQGSIIAQNDCSSIKASADAVRAVLTDNNRGLTAVRSLMLVTSALENQRATATFQKNLSSLGGGSGIRIIPKPTDFYTVQEQGDFRHRYRFPQDLIPNEHALARTGDLVQEYLTQVYYLLRGWLFSIN
jgi:uncharacterized SAM-binding protein YcdF (DUF218 family)